MKKLAAIVMVCVLAISFMSAALVTDVEAKNTQIKPICSMVLVCNEIDSRVYEVYFCPYGQIWIFTGEYCP